MLQKQVECGHYEFLSYITPERWSSLYWQIKLTLDEKPRRILEIGGGAGIFKHMCELQGIEVITVDIDESLSPDYLGDVRELGLSENDFDIVCAFQVLEHLPFEDFDSMIKRMARLTKSKVILSLPDVEPLVNYQFYLPKLGQLEYQVKWPFKRPERHIFDGQHYWE
ncbi:class I SAM-dependent methyltransferase, partial [Nostoc sp. CHAB 5844]|nr:class I SAM-dependent methyltransferase [Nostoc sp. CHAB 5844]